jgi:hypothetical protein
VEGRRLDVDEEGEVIRKASSEGTAYGSFARAQIQGAEEASTLRFPEECGR